MNSADEICLRRAMAKIAMLNLRERAVLNVAGCLIRVEIVRTHTEHWLGLSGRDRLAEDQGMLFVFPEAAQHSFWMRGVPFGLTIAFIRDTMEIAALRDMNAFSETHVASPEPVRLALEAPLGWFARRQIALGAKVKFAL